MSTDLSPENEQFIQHAIQCGTFQDRVEALDRAVELLRKRQALLEHIDEGTRQLRSGEYTEYDDEGLKKFFDEIKAEGRKRYEAGKKGPSAAFDLRIRPRLISARFGTTSAPPAATPLPRTIR